MHGNAVQQHEENAGKVAHSAPHRVALSKHELARCLGDHTEEHLRHGDGEVGDGKIQEQDIRRFTEKFSFVEKSCDYEEIPRERQDEVDSEYHGNGRGTFV